MSGGQRTKDGCKDILRAHLTNGQMRYDWLLVMIYNLLSAN
jgi:hypothetical protein